MAVAERRQRGRTASILLLASMLGGAYFLLAPNFWALLPSHGSTGGRGGGGGSGSPAGASTAGYTLAQYNVDTPTRRFGRQLKSGPVAILKLVSEGLTKEELCYPPAWRAPRLTGGDIGSTAAAAAATRQAPPCCNIMFNKRYRIIYLKAPKTAGTTLAANYFGLCGDPDADPDTCLIMLNYSRLKKVDMLLRAWDDWFVFSFSRNVLRRTISQYQVRRRQLAAAGSSLAGWVAGWVGGWMSGQVVGLADCVGLPAWLAGMAGKTAMSAWVCGCVGGLWAPSGNVTAPPPQAPPAGQPEMWQYGPEVGTCYCNTSL